MTCLLFNCENVLLCKYCSWQNCLFMFLTNEYRQMYCRYRYRPQIFSILIFFNQVARMNVSSVCFCKPKKIFTSSCCTFTFHSVKCFFFILRQCCPVRLRHRNHLVRVKIMFWLKIFVCFSPCPDFSSKILTGSRCPNSWRRPRVSSKKYCCPKHDCKCLDFSSTTHNLWPQKQPQMSSKIPVSGRHKRSWNCPVFSAKIPGSLSPQTWLKILSRVRITPLSTRLPIWMSGHVL